MANKHHKAPIDINQVLTALAHPGPTADTGVSELAAQIVAEINAAEQPPPEVKTPQVVTQEVSQAHRETTDAHVEDMTEDLDVTTDTPETSGKPLPFYGLEHTTTLRLSAVHSHTTENGWKGVLVEGWIVQSSAFERGTKRCIPWTDFALYSSRIHDRVTLDEDAKKRVLNNEKVRRRTFWAALSPTPVEPLSPDFKPEQLAAALAKAGRDGLLEQKPHDIVIKVTIRGYRKGTQTPFYVVEFLRPEAQQ
jgi:hypothetical protein